jgi:hypothetical protein
MWQSDLSDDLEAAARSCPPTSSLLDAAHALDRLTARLRVACDILCTVAIASTLALFACHALRHALRALAS